MNERGNRMEKVPTGSLKPVPMKLFAAWEVDRTPPNCIPRLCSIKITKLTLMTSFPSDLTSLSLSVKMQSSKRTLRSHEIPVPSYQTNSGVTVTPQDLRSPPIFETDLDLHFSLQYPHFLKRDGNRLLILLQRRKKYKSRTILGYKTLAEGVIRMDYILQRSVDMTVELMASGKSSRQSHSVATVRANQVSSIPVDADNKNSNSVVIADRMNEYSEEEEEQDLSSNEDNYDRIFQQPYTNKRPSYRKMVLPIDGPDDGNTKHDVESDSELENFGNKEKSTRAKINRRNFKQKIVALLKRFKIPEDLEGGTARGGASIQEERELDALFQELESLSCVDGEDSGQDMDNVSVGSTPKPSLRPFFSSSGQNFTENPSDRNVDIKNDSTVTDLIPAVDAELANLTDMAISSSPPKDKEVGGDRRSRIFRTTSGTANKKKQTLSFSTTTEQHFPTSARSLLEACLSPTNVEPRKVFMDQLSRTFFTSEINVLPETVLLIGPQEPHGGVSSCKTYSILSTVFKTTFSLQNTAEVKAILSALMNKIQKHCNSNAKPPNTIKVVLVGGDWLQGAVLRHYVDLLGVRPPDWIQHIRFYIVPIGPSAIARYLSSIDTMYGSLFGTDTWLQVCERLANLDINDTKNDGMDLVSRFQKYVYSNGPCTQVPIAEAMVNYKEEESCQIFVPFISDVKLICIDSNTISMEADDTFIGNLNLTPSNMILSGSPPQSGRTSPPFSSTFSMQGTDAVELQIDYWPNIKLTFDGKEKVSTKDKDQGKISIKSQFRNLQVWRLPPYPIMGEITNGLTLSYCTKEKKQKIMRLGKKKERDRDVEREQLVDSVSRIICSAKSHNAPLKVYIDGTEWTGVKFFQLSSQWQTHVRNFPIALIGTANLSDSS